jgi:putative heme-binding domain-containing protein
MHIAKPFSTLIALTTSLSISVAAYGDSNEEQRKRDRIVVEAMMRLDGIDANTNPKLLESVKRYVESLGNDTKQIEIVRKLKVSGMADKLIERAPGWGMSTQAVQAIDLAAEQGGVAKIRETLSMKEPDERAMAICRIAALSNKKDLMQMQESLLDSGDTSKAVKAEAAVALARSEANHAKLIQMTKDGKVPESARVLIGTTLRNSGNESVKKEAMELFPPVKSTSANLPPIDQLVKRKGNPGEGRSLYFGVATCSQCHTVGTEGKNVGPSLTEIGNKLSKEAMYVSILAPSAGISHNYESYAVRTEDEEVVVGLLVSDTAESITLRDAKGIERTFAKKGLDFKKQEKSLMPDNLQELVSEQGLVDLVEYLMTLKKQ